MSKQAADAHRRAAGHHEETARHYKAAVIEYEAGRHDRAAHHAFVAHGHVEHALRHSAEAAKAHAEEYGNQ